MVFIYDNHILRILKDGNPDNSCDMNKWFTIVISDQGPEEKKTYYRITLYFVITHSPEKVIQCMLHEQY